MVLPPHSHEALFAAARSGDEVTVRKLVADAKAAGTSLAALVGEAATHVAAEAEGEEVVRLLLSLHDFKAATGSSRLDVDAFYLNAMQSHIDIGRPPYFDGTDYAAWKHKMKMYLTAAHPSIWWIVEKGYSGKGVGNEHKNAVAVNAIIRSLSPHEYNKVYGLESAKEIWDTLQLFHEGISRVRKLKIELLMGKLDSFIMEEDETPVEMYNRLILIVNEIKGLGSKEMTDKFVVRIMLRAITLRNPIWATIIREREDLAKLKPHDVLTLIDVYFNESSSSKKECVAPKAQKEAKESSSEEDDMTLFKKRLKTILKGHEKSKERHSKRPCYECGETGHFMVNCPNKKNKDNDEKKENHNKSKSHKTNQKGQAYIGQEWDSNDSSSDSDDERLGSISFGLSSRRRVVRYHQ